MLHPIAIPEATPARNVKGYKMPETRGSPYIYVKPKRVLAWDGEDLTTMTRWLFEQ